MSGVVTVPELLAMLGAALIVHHGLTA